jgi:hypothetical protein
MTLFHKPLPFHRELISCRAWMPLLTCACLLLAQGFPVSHAHAAAPPGALNARDFGVKGDGASDDMPAMNRALAAAIQHGPGTVLFIPAGTYCLGERALISPGARRGSELHIANGNGLTVEGEAGATLVWRNLMTSVFDIEHSRNVTIRDLTLDADPLPFTQGVVKAYDSARGAIEIQVDKGFDDIDRPDLRQMTQLRIYDNPYCEGWKEDHYFPNLLNRVRIGPGDWQLTPAPARSPLEYQGFDAGIVGKKWMLWAEGYKGWAVRISHSDGCGVENLRIYEAGGSGAFELIGNGDVDIRRVYVGPPPGSGRLFSGGGGAMSFFNRGTVTLEDCDFSHVDDDCFNLGTHFLRVVEKAGPQSCRIESWPGDFVVGDTIALWDWRKKIERGEAKLTGAQKEKDGRWLLQFDRPLEIGAVGAGNPLAPRQVQEFDGIDRVTDLESAGACILRGNRMSSMRARCFLVKTGHSLIEDNILHDTHMPAILAGPEFYWGEGPQLRGLIIRHNTFEDDDGPNISVATFDSASSKDNEDVTIEDNHFADYGRFTVVYRTYDKQGVVIKVHNTTGVTIRNNHFAAPPPGCPKADPIEVGTCSNVRVSP